MPHNASQRMEHKYLIAGNSFVTDRPAIISTVLGSCVAVCLWDPASLVGGINHFIMPVWDGRGAASERFGDISTRGLIRKVIARGATLKRLKARVFGGASPLGFASLKNMDAGRKNVEVALRVLEEAGIPVVESQTGGRAGIKVTFNTANGSVSFRDVGSRYGVSFFGGP